MIAEFGHYALVLAFALSLAQSVLPMVGAQRGIRPWMSFARPAAFAQLGFVGFAFLALTVCFVRSDFSVALVYEHSHSQQPLIYKITATWGNHEGSLLLWVLILAIFGALVALFGENLPPRLKARALSVQGMIGFAFLAFMLFTSNPFDRLSPAPLEGQELNPLLQDPGLAMHPPMLYLGYVGLSMTFSFAVAAMIEGRVDAAWAVGCGPGPCSPGPRSRPASHWARTGPITNWAGAAGGPGIRSRTPPSCPGWSRPRCCTARPWWRSATP